MNRQNQRYAKYISPDKIEYAPVAFNENNSIIVPIQTDDEFYHSRDYYTVSNNPPSNGRYVFSRWEKDDDAKTITAVYVEDDIEPEKTVHKYSKLKLTMFMMELGIWEDVKEWLNGMGYYDLYLMAQVFADDNDNFNDAINGFRDTFSDRVGNIDAVIQQALGYALIEE